MLYILYIYILYIIHVYVCYSLRIPFWLGKPLDTELPFGLRLSIPSAPVSTTVQKPRKESIHQRTYQQTMVSTRFFQVVRTDFAVAHQGAPSTRLEVGSRLLGSDGSVSRGSASSMRGMRNGLSPKPIPDLVSLKGIPRFIPFLIPYLSIQQIAMRETFCRLTCQAPCPWGLVSPCVNQLTAVFPRFGWDPRRVNRASEREMGPSGVKERFGVLKIQGINQGRRSLRSQQVAFFFKLAGFYSTGLDKDAHDKHHEPQTQETYNPRHGGSKALKRLAGFEGPWSASEGLLRVAGGKQGGANVLEMAN